MKDFLKYTLATITGIITLFVVITIISIISFVGVLASSEAATPVASNSVFVLQLNGELEERGEDANPIAAITGGDVTCMGLDNVMEAIEKAKDNDDIKGIYIEAGSFSADSWASLQAIRKALLDFKKSGKWIVSYADNYTQGTYYLCSTADKVLMNPQGMVDWHGMASEPIFLKDLLAKFGVKVQLTKVGKYKSAPEMFCADKMSEPNREQVTVYVNGIWDTVTKDVAASRKLTQQKLNEYADKFLMIVPAEDLVKMKMVDKLVFRDEVKDVVKEMLGIDKEESVNQLTLDQMLKVKGAKNDADDVIAVYYAYGDIVDEPGSGLSQGHEIVGRDVCKDLEELKDDEDVKAVVLRINSGGGSAYASEQMWQMVKKLKAKKPVVVSMGGMAASGGYYMSCLADHIVAEPTTLTGSIGIFGMFPDYSDLITNKLGVKTDLIKTNKHSDFGSMYRSFNPEELALLDTYITRGYDLFLSRVAEGRNMTKEQVDEIAQGRVWLGKDAVTINLVDELGGLDKAIAKAAELANTDDYKTESYPGASDWAENLLKTLNDESGSLLDEKLKANLGALYEPMMLIGNMRQQNPIQARLPLILTVR